MGGGANCSKSPLISHNADIAHFFQIDVMDVRMSSVVMHTDALLMGVDPDTIRDAQIWVRIGNGSCHR